VLCHAAYSPLWQGPLDQRRADLGLQRCVSLGLDHTFPSQVQAGQSNTLTITASSLAIVEQDGDPLPVEDVHLELEPSPGLTLGADSGATNADGVFTTTATLAQGQTTMSIDVAAFDREGGEELATAQVIAQVVLPGTATIDAVQGETSCLGPGGDNALVDSNGSWSLSCDSETESVSASATVTTEGDDLVYSGSGTIDAPSGAGVIASYVSITVSGGPVRWELRERLTGDVPSDPFLAGCYVNDRFGSTSSASGSGVLDPGEHEITHNCGGAQVDATMEWTLTLGG
jgi:hypothetical protein